MKLAAGIVMMVAASVITGGAAAGQVKDIAPYLMADRAAEVGLARSAAPTSVSGDAEVWVLGRNGYEKAAKGTNGFVCMVDRSWMLPLDNPDYWNPAVRLPACMNAPAARMHLPLTFKTTALVLAGRSTTQISSDLKAQYATHALPLPEAGSMCYMMSKGQNFGPKFGAADPHLMFWFPQNDKISWGAEFPGTPVDVHEYTPQPITEFAISVSHWSDGTLFVEPAAPKQ